MASVRTSTCSTACAIALLLVAGALIAMFYLPHDKAMESFTTRDAVFNTLHSTCNEAEKHTCVETDSKACSNYIGPAILKDLEGDGADCRYIYPGSTVLQNGAIVKGDLWVHGCAMIDNESVHKIIDAIPRLESELVKYQNRANAISEKVSILKNMRATVDNHKTSDDLNPRW